MKIEFTKQQLAELGYQPTSQNNTKQVNNTKLVFDEETIRALFGHEAAEDENVDRLKKYYLKTDVYERMKSNIPLFILVGHKGVGKSALIRVLSNDDIAEGRIPIAVQPNDILNLDVSESNFLKKIQTWKDGLANIIFNNLIRSIKDAVIRNPKNAKWKKWVDRFNDIASAVIGKKVADLQDEQINLSSTSFTTLFKNTIFEEKQVIIYLDDLDRGWENSELDIKNLSAMLNAVRDLSRDIQNLKFRLSLRSDVYYAVRTSDETTDKIDGSVIWQSWTNHEILVMLIKRIETYFGHKVDDNYLLNTNQNLISHYLDSVFEKRFNGNGHWENAPMHRVIMSLIRKRPRDLVKLCTLAARQAYKNKHNKILTNDLESVFINYSNDRLTDTSTEYKSELPQIKELLLKMKPSKRELDSKTPCLFTRQQLLEKLRNILSMSRLRFKNGTEVSPESLAAFLYKINFLTARKNSNGKILRVYYDENQYIYNDFTDFGYSYEIHPAYRWALQPNTTMDIFKQLELLNYE